jgi:ribulose-phosphate 3-epimerase
MQESTSFHITTPGIRVAPSLLAADFSRLREQVAVVERAGAEILHLDVMDGHFVPNISFGAGVIASLRPCTRMFFDAHLMIADPARYAKSFADAGCDHITFHIETTDAPGDVVRCIRDLGVSVGVCVNPTTELPATESIIEEVDMVLVMSVWPGFGGQRFIADVLPKVAQVRERLAGHQRLEIDGGIDAKTVALAVRAGADTLVAGSAIFGKPDPAQAFHELTRLACGTGL